VNVTLAEAGIGGGVGFDDVPLAKGGVGIDVSLGYVTMGSALPLSFPLGSTPV
jgi:hypothetical protein